MPTIAPQNPGQRGYKAHAIQRGETFSVLFPILRPKPGFNERVVFTGIPELAESIRTNGFSKNCPLIVEWSAADQCFYIIHGERRYRACKHLHDQGIDPGPIWCMSEERGKEPLQQLIDQVLTNTGEQFTPLEKGRLYLRIQRDFPGTTGSDIAARVGETKQAVSQALRLAKLSCAAIQDAIIAGSISCSTAQQILDSAGDDPAAQVKLLDETLAAARSTGKSHATPKHLPATPNQQSSIPNPQSEITHPLPGTTEIIVPPDDEAPSVPSDPSVPSSSTGSANPGFQQTLSAPSTNRDGSSGPGSGKYEKPDKRMASAEKLLDELSDLKDEAKSPDRIRTAEILLRFLNNETDRKSLKDHLLGN